MTRDERNLLALLGVFGHIGLSVYAEGRPRSWQATLLRAWGTDPRLASKRPMAMDLPPELANAMRMLGVHSFVTRAELARARRKLAALHHSDHTGGSEAKMIEVNVACDVVERWIDRREAFAAGAKKATS